MQTKWRPDLVVKPLRCTDFVKDWENWLELTLPLVRSKWYVYKIYNGGKQTITFSARYNK